MGWTVRAFGAAFLAMMMQGQSAVASECFQLADRGNPLLKQAALKTEEVSIRFIGHSTYLMENAEGLRIATDWSGDFASRLEGVPNVVTMNHAHETHWTAFPDEDIDHALEGWGEKGNPRRHFLRIGETLIRNVPTDIRGGYAGIEPFGNSIFLFEIGDLCVGHLGHIHHVPTEEQYALLGRMDVVMVPIDGTFTLAGEELKTMLQRLRAQVVLPMHAFGSYTIARFMDSMSSDFKIKYLKDNDLVLSQDLLPEEPTIFVPTGL